MALTELHTPSMSLAQRRFLDTSIDRLRLGGKKLTTNVAAALTDASLEFSIEAASTLDITIFDPHRTYLRSGVLTKGYGAAVYRTDTGGWDKFSLVRVAKSGDSLQLTFEDETVARLRTQFGIKKASRDSMTRAQFAYALVKELTHPTVGFYSPEIFDKQAVEFSSDVIKMQDQKTTASQDKASQPYGFSGNVVKVKGVVASAEQRSVISQVLAVCVKRRVSKKLLICAIMTITEEADATNPSGGDRDSQGAFQQRPSAGWTGLTNIDKATNQWLDGNPSGSQEGGSVKVLQAHPDWTEHRICAEVQRNYDWKANDSSSGAKSYGRWTSEARDTVNAYLGADAKGYRGSTDRVGNVKTAKYEFTRGNPDNPDQAESSWDALQRLAQEVNWRCYAYRGTVYFVSDDELISHTPIDVIRESDPGVTVIDFDYDVGQDAQSVGITCTAERWGAAPGSVVQIAGLGPMASGSWLVSDISRSMFDPMATVTVKKYSPKKLEPAPEVTSTQTNIDTGQATGSEIRDKIVQIAGRETNRGDAAYVYAQVRPYPSSFSQTPIRTDCSGFAEMVYRDAGAPDPNGTNFDGSGNTDSQQQHGKAVQKPKPGDLVFYSNPGHVVIYLGNGQAASFGSEPAPHIVNINYRPYVAIRSYLND
jgi:hypothetical protein